MGSQHMHEDEREDATQPKVNGMDEESTPLRLANGTTNAETDQHEGALVPEKVEDAPLVTPRLFKRRWFMAFLFATYSLSNAYQWIHLNIIANVILRYYNESLPGTEYQQKLAIDWLSMVYMLAYIPLIIPASWLLDKKGLRVCGILATLLNAVGAWLKCAAVSPGRFPLLMVAQTICATAQIFILGIPAHLAAVWFGPNEVATATAIGVFGNQLGCAVGFLIPPEIVPNDDDLNVVGQRLSYMFYGTAAVTTTLFIIVCIVFKNGPPVPPSQAQAALVKSASEQNYTGSLKRLFFNKGFILLMVTYGINTGSYYAIGTQLNRIILAYFVGKETDAGRIGLTLVVSGVVGSILAGLWLDFTKLFKWTTVGIYFMSFAGMVVFTFTLGLGHMWVVYVCGGLLGLFMTGYLPVGFEFAAEITYPEPEGTSSGLLNASAQLFGIILTIGMGAIIDRFSMLPANCTICGVLLLGTIMTALIKAELRRQEAGKQMLKEEEEKLEISV